MASEPDLGKRTQWTIALAAFVFVEHRQRVPLLDLNLFRNGTFTGANIVVDGGFLAKGV